MDIQTRISELKAIIEPLGGEDFELDIGTVEELASISTIADCFADFQKQIKRELTDEEKQNLEPILADIAAFNADYIKQQVLADTADIDAQLDTEVE